MNGREQRRLPLASTGLLTTRHSGVLLVVMAAMVVSLVLMLAAPVLAEDQATPPSEAAAVAAPAPASVPAPGLTRYDQNSSALVYSGTWANYAKTVAWAGSYKRASTAGASVTVTFSGTQLDWIAMKGTTTGIADVYVDGIKRATVDLASPVAVYQQNVWSTATLPDGVHTVQLVRNPASAAGKYITIDAVDVAGTLLEVDRLEQSDPLLAYGGSWVSRSGSAYTGGADKYTDVAGSAVMVEFTGTRLVWIGKTAATYGIARVTLDGSAVFEVDLYSVGTLYQQRLWDSGDLPNAPHTVKIECLGTRNPLARAGYVGVDAFDLIGTASRAYMWNHYEETHPAILYSGTWSSVSAAEVSGGSEKRAGAGSATLSVTFTGRQLDWTTTIGPEMGTADVSVDGAPAVPVILTSDTVRYQQQVWSSGRLTDGSHRVEISWDEANSPGAVIGVDAFDVLGTLPVSSTPIAGDIRWVEQRLAELSYRPGPVDGVFDAKTKGAVIAFQKWEGLSRTGQINSATWTRLQTATRPKPHRASAASQWIEVNKTKQVLLYCKDGAVYWTLPVSTGSASVGIATPSGDRKVTRKTTEISPRYRPLYISTTLLAIHGYPSVPTYPASHGCVRTHTWDQDALWPLIPVGTPVYIY